MLVKLRRGSSSKDHGKGRRSQAVAKAAEEASIRPTSTCNEERLGFFSLPTELRNVIYEHVAKEARLRILSPKERKAYNGSPPQPGLLTVSRQSRNEYLPLLLSLAHVRVAIREFDFRHLMGVVRSLYRTELKALRQNDRLTIQLVGQKCRGEWLTPLRVWLEDRGRGLDRLPWHYTVLWTPHHQVLPTSTAVLMANVMITRKKILHQNLEALGQLYNVVEEMTQFDLQAVMDAFEREVFNTRALQGAA